MTDPQDAARTTTASHEGAEMHSGLTMPRAPIVVGFLLALPVWLAVLAGLIFTGIIH